MRSFVSTYKYYLLLILIFLLSELLVNPIGDFPLNDDWTYGKSVLILKNEGRINVGDFAAMTLFSHLIWGGFFTKIFGFSFTVLRFSTLISSLIGILTLNKLVFSISKNKVTAFVASLVLLFNPLYFSLSNTFMTDVSFTTLLILSCYFAYDFFKTQNKISFVLVFVMSALLVLIRQYGIIVPVCFAVSCLLNNEKKWIYFLFAILLTLGVYGIFKYYENYLHGILPRTAAYKFSGDVKVGSSNFWELFLYHWEIRYKKILLNVLIYTFPFTLFFLNSIIKSFKPLTVLVVAVASFFLVYFLFAKEDFMIGNVFTNLSLGAETFYETLTPEIRDYPQHTYIRAFDGILIFVRYLFGGLSLFVLIGLAVEFFSNFRNPFKKEPILFFLISLFAGYVFLILITESYFDRYHIPLVALLLIMFGFVKQFEGDAKLIMLPLILFFYVSVFGTKDYLQVNRIRWEAYHYLRQDKQIANDKIDGGFEMNCWNEGKYNWWADFINLDNFDYLIQYHDQPGFKVYKEYKFQRYLPYKQDAVKVFIKETKEKLQ